MMLHPDQQELLQYLSDELSEDRFAQVEEHLGGCDECFERLKALYYLKENFTELWDGDIRILNTPIQSNGSDTKENWRGIVMSSRRRIRIAAAAAAVVLLVGSIFTWNLVTNKTYKGEWAENGIVSSNVNLSGEVGKEELASMIAALAGVTLPETEMMKDSGELKVQDAADAIKVCFKLKQGDEAAMLSGVDSQEVLTYETALELIDNFAGQLYEPEDAAAKVDGNLVINKDGTVLADCEVTGNLYLMQGIGNGEVTLNNVTVDGNVYVLGGGMSTIILDHSTTGDMVVNKTDGQVRVLALEGSTVASVELQSGAKLQNDSSNSEAFQTVQVSADVPKDSEIKLNGDFGKVEVLAPAVNIQVEKGNVQEFKVDKAAADVKVEVSEEAAIINYTNEAEPDKVNPTGASNNGASSAQDSTSVVSDGDNTDAAPTEDTIGGDLLKKEYKHFVIEYYKDFDQWDETKKQALINDLDAYMAVAGNIDSRIESPESCQTAVIGDYIILPVTDMEVGIRDQLGSALCNFKPEYDMLLTDKEQADKVREFLDQDVMIVKKSDIQSITSLRLAPVGGPEVMVNDLSFLTYFTGLQSLYIGHFHHLSELSFLSSMSWLKSLELESIPGLTDLSCLAGLTGLETLNLRFVIPDSRHVAGVEALKSLTNLHTIVMQSLSDWIPYLYYAPNLTDVSLYFCSHVNLSMLTSMPQLKRLSIYNSSLDVPMWNTILSLKGLESLHIDSENLYPKGIPEDETDERTQEEKLADWLEEIHAQLPNCQLN